jgi:hypothetical protein
MGVCDHLLPAGTSPGFRDASCKFMPNFLNNYIVGAELGC